jgi:hypothetical protein
MFKEIVDHFVFAPRKNQIKIDFNLRKKNIHLSIPIFFAREGLPKVIKDYIETRKNSHFKPHITSFQMDEKSVLLLQEIPFAIDFQESMRKGVSEFCQLAKHCTSLLSELAIEDRLKGALHLDTHLQE